MFEAFIEKNAYSTIEEQVNEQGKLELIPKNKTKHFFSS